MAKKKAKTRKAAPEPIDAEALRADVGKDTLAEHVLETLASAIAELERSYVEVAALGKSLRLAREQLAEQDAELQGASAEGWQNLDRVLH